MCWRFFVSAKDSWCHFFLPSRHSQCRIIIFASFISSWTQKKIFHFRNTLNTCFTQITPEKYWSHLLNSATVTVITGCFEKSQFNEINWDWTLIQSNSWTFIDAPATMILIYFRVITHDSLQRFSLVSSDSLIWYNCDTLFTLNCFRGKREVQMFPPDCGRCCRLINDANFSLFFPLRRFFKWHFSAPF